MLTDSFSLFYLLNNNSQLAVNANMKNTDQHIILLGWSADDDKSEVAIIDIERDKWVPRIELQGTSRLQPIFVT